MTDAPTETRGDRSVELDGILFEVLVTPDGRADPYPHYERLRAIAPVFRSGLGPWVATRYADCQHVLRVPAFGKADGADALARARAARLARWGMDAPTDAELEEFVAMSRSMLTLNPPDHTRLRGLVARAFTPSRVQSMRPDVEALCDRLVDELADRSADGDGVELMSELAFPLPVAVIGELLGVPHADREQFQSLVRTTTAALEPLSTVDDLRAARGARIEMEDYFRALVTERRRAPRDDLLSQLIAVRDGTDQLGEDELIITAILLFAAGFETTTNLIGNGLLALLRHPDQLATTRTMVAAGDAEGVARAVEELLRWDSPVQLDARIAHEDTTVAGIPVSKGDEFMTLLGAANRDPEHYRDPGRLDVRRAEGPPMSFGSGIHLCLGASLARLEGQVVLQAMLGRFRTIELRTDDIRYRDRITLRGLVELPVALVAA